MGHIITIVGILTLSNASGFGDFEEAKIELQKSSSEIVASVGSHSNKYKTIASNLVNSKNALRFAAIGMALCEIPRIIYLYKLTRFLTSCGFLRDTVKDRSSLLYAVNLLLFSHFLTFFLTLAITIITGGIVDNHAIQTTVTGFIFLILATWWRWDIKKWVEIRKHREDCECDHHHDHGHDHDDHHGKTDIIESH